MSNLVDRLKPKERRGSKPIHFMHFNFERIHQTLKITPVMAAKSTPKLWEMSDMVKGLEDWEVTHGKGS